MLGSSPWPYFSSLCAFRVPIKNHGSSECGYTTWDYFGRLYLLSGSGPAVLSTNTILTPHFQLAFPVSFNSAYASVPHNSIILKSVSTLEEAKEFLKI